MKYKIAATPILAAFLLIQACGASNFATQLRVILAASGPLINSLNLGDKKAAVVADFTDLAQGAANLADDLKACNTDKVCKLDAVSRFEVRFWDIERRGHFKLSPKLENIKNILAGIIASAKIYYGAPPKGEARAEGVPAPNAEKQLNDKLEELKAAMKVVPSK